MVERRPLIVRDGRIEEIPSGDTISSIIAPGSGGGSGATAFLSLTDTPATFGTAGQMLAVNAATDALEWVDAPSAAAGVVPVYSSPAVELPVGTSASTSAAATKANFFTALIGMRITHVNVRVNTSHGGEVFAAVVSGKSTSDTVLSIQKGTYASLTTGTGADNNIALSTPLKVSPGDIVLIGITRTDGTGSSNPGTYYQTNTSYESVYYTKGAGSASLRIEDNDITVGQALTGAITFNDNWSVGFTYQLLSGSLPVGGTTGQVLAKIDGTNYNTEWVNPPSVTMTQTEITATAYSTVSADFTGNVVRRMNNASAQTVTVEPNMTGGQPVTFIATGAGAVSFVAGTGVTIHSAGGNLTIAGQYGSATLIPDADTADTYYLIGNLTT